MNRLEKKQFVEKFSKGSSDYLCMFVVRQTGLSAKAVMQLRREARANGVVFKVVKNTLAKIALKDRDLGLDEAFKGSTGVLLSQDPVAAAKLIETFSKKREDFFYPIMGVVSGKAVDQVDIKRMASLPSLDQIRSQIIGLIQSPATRIARIVQEPGSQIARVLEAYSKK